MAIRYEHSFLLFLRDSPLCVRPKLLPPEDDWMGPRAERRQTVKTPTDRTKFDSSVLDPLRRQQSDRNSSRNADDAIGHFRSGIGSTTPRLGRFSDSDKQRDGDSLDRYLHNRANTDGDNDRHRDLRGFRRRDDQDSEGWSTVRPRKSFGNEGAERFTGRMGGGDRFSDRRTRDSDRDVAVSGRDDDSEGRPRNTNSTFTAKSKDGTWFRQNGSAEPTPSRTSERLDKVKTAKSWRDRDETIEEPPSNSNHRNYERRWGGRDQPQQRHERNPEWMDEPAGDDGGAHNADDFRKFMEEMKNRDSGGKAQSSHAIDDDDHDHGAPLAQATSPRNSLPPKKIDLGPDKFFATFAATTSAEKGTPTGENQDSSAGKGGKSRFMSLFNSGGQEDGLKLEVLQHGPLSAPIPGHMPVPGAGGMLPGAPMPGALPSSNEDQVAFQNILSKLKINSQGSQGTPPSVSGYQPPSQPHSQPQHPNIGMPLPTESRPRNDGSAPANAPVSANVPVTGPPADMFRQYGREAPMGGQQNMHEMMASQPMMAPVPPSMQLLQSIVGHRQQQSAQNNRMESGGSQHSNSNTEFLMNLMRKQPDTPIDQRLQQQQQSQQPPSHQPPQQPQQQSTPQPHPIPPPQQQSAPPMMQQQPPKPMHMPQGPPGLSERDEFLIQQQQRMQQNFVAQQHGRGMPQMQRAMRPPGFMDDYHHEGSDPRQGPQPNQMSNPNQMPNQLLQRGPPNMDAMPMTGGPSANPNQWMPSGPPPQNQQRPMMPPPGLAAGGPGPNRNGPPPGMFPGNFPMGGFPPEGMPPNGMPGMPPRNMMPPPGIYGGGAPPPMNFYPPPGMSFQGGPNGPDGPYGPGPGGPYDARGIPMGAPQRGAFPRQ